MRIILGTTPSSFRRPCDPLCKLPEKRDFMDVNPEKTEEDFYRNYDPMVGIGTAFVLSMFFIMVTINSFIRWGIRRWHLFKYKRTATKLAKIASRLEEKNKIEVTITEPTPSNGTLFVA